MKKLFCIILCIFSGFISDAIAQEDDLTKLQPSDYANLELPSLKVLFENAQKSSTVKFYNTRKEEQESLVKTEKRRWMENIRGVGSYQYGKTGVLSYSQNNASLYYYSDIEQSFYSVGVAVSVPLSDIFDRKNRIRRQKFAAEAMGLEAERWLDEQKLRIIEAYTSAQQYLSVLKMRIEALSLADAQYRLAQSDFTSGKINAQELNIQKGFQVSALSDYEQNRAFLNRALLQLEVLSETKIVNK
ncbi:MAG: TolC family protein [Mangrovibacterium sp.]|jgi:outer membrane protein TolC